MKNDNIVFIGLDTHKEHTQVSYTLDHRTADINDLGRIQTTKSAFVRVEGAHSYRHAAKISKEMQVRQEELPKAIIDKAWSAQLRLCRRYQRLTLRGKPPNVVVTAIAREMIAFIWSISREIVLSRVDPKTRLSRVHALPSQC